jgi:hypothetical protein
LGQVEARGEDAETDQGQEGDQPVTEELPPAAAELLEEAPAATVDKRADLALAVVVMLLGLAVVYLSRDIRHGVLQDPIGPAGFASVLGGLIAALGLILVVRRLVSWRRSGGRVYADGGEGDELGLPASGIRPFVILAVGFGWDLMLPRIGFIVATWLACLVAMVAMRTRSVVKLVVIPICFSLLTWVLFTRLSGLRFPAGPVDLFFASLIPRMN